ncbi:hypothetical protein [Nitrospina gracilis]|uniref:hypothetical protein n=1 Tax=Nitrospina gracilis TaxID=35801 RepID=UPI001F1CD6E7|nr:hypothetical protein [Nitrospina gracilis]MCF8720863.1 hypothetical protein [Nitrospina gracilis Nb-211]
MSASPSLLQWTVALILLALFVWVAAGLVLDHLPWTLIDTSDPGKKRAAAAVLLVLGGLGYFTLRDLLGFVWMGLRYLLGMEYEGL